MLSGADQLPPSGLAAGALLQLGSRVEVQGEMGTIRFMGNTDFSAGKWVGIELDEPTGKNDGSVHGRPYFSCQPNYGKFVRPSQVRPAPSATGAAPEGTAMPPPTPGPLSRGRRGESLSLVGSRSQSGPGMAAGVSTPSTRFRSPTTSSLTGPGSALSAAGSSSRLLSPTRTPSASLGSRLVSPTPNLRNASPAGPSGMPPPSSRLTTPRRTRGTSTPGQAPPTTDRATRLPATAGSPRMAPARLNKRLSYSGGRQSTPSPTTPQSPSGPNQPSRLATTPATRPSVITTQLPLPISEEPVVDEAPTAAVPFTPTLVHHSLTEAFTGQGARADTAVSNKEHEELRLKLKILESKRQEDRQKIKEAERLHEQAEQFLHIKEKLTSKLTDMQQELKDVKRQLKTAAFEKAEIEAQCQRAEEAFEMMSLDREMAEEKADNLGQEVQVLKEKLDETNDRLAVQDNPDLIDADLADTEGTERAMDPAQMKRQIGRLKEALLRMRDLSSETENDLRRKIKALEKDLAQAPELKAQNSDLKVRLETAEGQVEELTSRLDDSLAAEDLVEQLTMRNLDLTEKVEEMRVKIEDLESLKELNDEMEESHIETEKQLNAELEFKDSMLRELQKKLDANEETMADYEATIQQFRVLVKNLQDDLAQRRSREAEQQFEAKELSSQSQAMLSLNLQLQSTVMKAQAKAIDLELRKLDAQQATEHLRFLEPYLPSSFFQHENNAICCLLLFKRLVFKTDLLVKQLDDQVEKSDKGMSVDSLQTAQLRLALTTLGAGASRFVAHLCQCPADTFLKLGFLHHDVSSIEKRLNTTLDQLRQEELVALSALADVQRAVHQLDGLLDTHIPNPAPLTITEHYLGMAHALDLQAEVIFSQLILARQQLLPQASDDDAPSFAEADQAALHTDLFMPLDAVIQRCKAYKVISTKLLRRVREFSHDATQLVSAGGSGGQGTTPVSLLQPRFRAEFEAVTTTCLALGRYAHEVRATVTSYVAECREDREPLNLATVQAKLLDLSEAHLQQCETLLWTTAEKHFTGLNDSVTELVETISHPDALLNYECAEAPWYQRAQQFKAELVLNVEVEQKLQTLNEEIMNLIREIKLKDQALQESGVKIELLEKRMETVKKQAETIARLEAKLHKGKDQQRIFEEAMDNLQTELEQLEQENHKLKKAAAKAEKYAARGKSGDLDEVAHMSSIEVLELKQRVDALAAAVKYLRSENVYLKRQHLPQTWALSSFPTSGHSTRVPLTAVGSKAPQAVSGLVVETQALLREVQMVSASVKVVDITSSSAAKPTDSHAQGSGVRKWRPRQSTPQYAFNAQQTLLHTLQQRSQTLHAKMQSMQSPGLRVPRLARVAPLLPA
ncbi:hypothetical protein H4R34_002907 [Dimargaris verticillata]|uniref:CAP-Gly domain-containing protein n=1 Tax=Dimargaris verticillata TaxID=2761393 RepID=A0A9W8ED47_9FUNG|nr:hypothetical protein H4R34_002907 [Dimargaris verticillata]